MPNKVTNPSLSAFRDIAFYAKGKRYAWKSTLFFAISTVICAVTGRLTHISGFYDGSMGTGSATFLGGIVTSACAYQERQAKNKFIQPFHDDFVRRQIVSVNNLLRTYRNKDLIFRDDIDSACKRMNKLREAIAIELAQLPFHTDFEDALISKKLVEEHGVGNCHELSFKYFSDLMQEFPDLDLKIDVYEILNGDHCFLVIGREVESDPSDYRTWGEHAMIYDPWASEFDDVAFYPATELESRLRDAKYDDQTPEKAILRPINFSTQKLKCMVSNIYSPKEFEGDKKPKTEKVLELLEALRSFHKPGADKVAIANKMLKMTAEYLQGVKSLKAQYAFGTLQAQLKHFLSARRANA